MERATGPSPSVSTIEEGMVACAVLLGTSAQAVKVYALVEGGALTAAKMVAAVSQDCELKEVTVHCSESVCCLQLSLLWCI